MGNKGRWLWGTVLGLLLGFPLGGIPAVTLAQSVSEVSDNDALAEAERLNQRAFELYQQGQYNEAEPLLQQSLKIRQEPIRFRPC